MTLLTHLLAFGVGVVCGVGLLALVSINRSEDRPNG